MGRPLRAARIVRTMRRRLDIPIVKRRPDAAPPWLAVVEAIPPAEILTRPIPMQHRLPNPKMTKPRKVYLPQEITYEEDELRRRFFRDHPWELARPRVIVEFDGKDARYYDWSRGLRQPGIPLTGEWFVSPPPLRSPTTVLTRWQCGPATAVDDAQRAGDHERPGLRPRTERILPPTAGRGGGETNRPRGSPYGWRLLWQDADTDRHAAGGRAVREVEGMGRGPNGKDRSGEEPGVHFPRSDRRCGGSDPRTRRARGGKRIESSPRRWPLLYHSHLYIKMLYSLFRPGWQVAPRRLVLVQQDLEPAYMPRRFPDLATSPTKRLPVLSANFLC